jgi:RNA polymerase sigma-70 factor (ECF subfamily)
MKSTCATNELVRRLKQGGDDETVRLLVERFGPRLLSAATLLCGNATDAQDLMIDTLQHAVRSIKGFREEASFFSWLYGILFNLNRAVWRKRAKLPLVYTDELPEVAADAPVVGGGLDAAAAADNLAAAVRQLSEPLQAVVVLRYYGEMSIAEVAAALRISPGTVKSRLFSATRKLKELLPEEMRP